MMAIKVYKNFYVASMRMSYNGNTLGFQPNNAGSIPAIRFTIMPGWRNGRRCRFKPDWGFLVRVRVSLSVFIMPA